MLSSKYIEVRSYEDLSKYTVVSTDSKDTKVTSIEGSGYSFDGSGSGHYMGTQKVKKDKRKMQTLREEELSSADDLMIPYDDDEGEKFSQKRVIKISLIKRSYTINNYSFNIFNCAIIYFLKLSQYTSRSIPPIALFALDYTTLREEGKDNEEFIKEGSALGNK